MTATPTGAPQEQRRGLRSVWLALLGSVGVYAIVFALSRHASQAHDTRVLGSLRPAFWITALVLAWLSTRRRRTFLASFNPVATDAVERLRMTCIPVWAMSEATAVIGLLLGFFTHSLEDFVPFALLSVLLLYLHRPAAWPTLSS